MCVSDHFCNRSLFSISSFSVLCSKSFEVMKFPATWYDESNVDINPFLILNMEKPKIFEWHLFFVIMTKVCTNYPTAIIIACTNYYSVSKSVYKMSLPQRKLFKCVYSYMLKLIQIMV